MEIASKIIHDLNIHGRVVLSGLGVLSMKTRHAKVDAENDKILPPKQEVVFSLDRSVKEDNQYLSSSSILIKELLEKGESQINGLGKWTNVAGKIEFFPEDDIFGNSFFGFEEIVVPRVSQTSNSGEEADKFNFSKSFVWIVLIAIPVAAIAYFAVTDPQLLLGKPSNLQTKPEPIKPVIEKPIPVDSALIKRNDSLIQDSIQSINKTTIPQVSK